MNITGDIVCNLAVRDGIISDLAGNTWEDVNSNVTIVDSSGGGAIYDKSIHFNGTPSALVTDNSKFNLKSDFTVSIWFKIKQAKYMGMLITIYKHGGINYIKACANDTDIYPIACVNNYQFGSGNYTKDTWAHIALTRSNGTIRSFTNGIKGQSYSYTGDFDLYGDVKKTSIGIVYSGLTNNFCLYGDINELVVISGQALWTDNFTTPTEPLVSTRQNYSLYVSNNNVYGMK